MLFLLRPFYGCFGTFGVAHPDMKPKGTNNVNIAPYLTNSSLYLLVILYISLNFAYHNFSCDNQGCIICSILPSGMGARGVSSEHVENMEMFSLFSNLGALGFSENLVRYSLHICLRKVKNNLFSFKNSYLRHFS